MELRRWWTRELGTVWVCDLKSSAPPPVPARRAAIFQEIASEMCEPLSDVMGFADPHQVLERFRAGSRCFVALVDGVIVSYAWASRGCEHVGELERVFVLPEGDFYIWDCATVPTHRSERLYTALLSHMLSQLDRDGVHRVWIGASRANRFSIRGILLAGFRPAMSTHYTRLWRFRYLRLVPHPSAPSALAEDAAHLIGREDERQIGSIYISIGEPAQRVCTAMREA